MSIRKINLISDDGPLNNEDAAAGAAAARPKKIIRSSGSGGGVSSEVSPPLLNALGISKTLLGRFEEAKEDFRLALNCVGASYAYSPSFFDDLGAEDENKKKKSSLATRKVLYDEGMLLYTDMLPISENADDPTRLVILLHNAGQSLLRGGKFSQAKSCFNEALKTLSPDCRSNALMDIRLNSCLGYCLFLLDRNEDSLKMYQKALSLAQETDLGRFHVANAKNSVAVLQYHEAPAESDWVLDYFRFSLAAYKEVFGSVSSQVATVLNNIGRLLYHRKDYSQAYESYADALRMRCFVLDPGSIDVAATACNLGQVLHSQGELDKALIFYNYFLECAQTNPSICPRDVSVVVKCVGDIHHERGSYDLAKSLYLEALDKARRDSSSTRPEQVILLNKLGSISYHMHRFDEAIEYYKAGLVVARESNEDSDIDSDDDSSVSGALMCFLNVARVHRKLGNLSQAYKAYEEIYKLQKKIHGPNSFEAAAALSSMGLMKYLMEDYPASFDLYQQVLQIQRDQNEQRQDNLGISRTLSSIGLVLFDQGCYDLAKNCYTESLRMRASVQQTDDLDTSVLIYNLATVCWEIGDEVSAISYHEEALRIQENVLGRSHPDVIRTLQHLGIVHQRLGDVHRAMHYFGRAIESEMAKDRKNFVAIAKLFNLIGNIYLQIGDVANMMRCYVESARIYNENNCTREVVVIAGFNFYTLTRLHPPSAAAA